MVLQHLLILIKELTYVDTLQVAGRNMTEAPVLATIKPKVVMLTQVRLDVSSSQLIPHNIYLFSLFVGGWSYIAKRPQFCFHLSKFSS